jgi:hypothetical protein
MRFEVCLDLDVDLDALQQLTGLDALDDLDQLNI